MLGLNNNIYFVDIINEIYITILFINIILLFQLKQMMKKMTIPVTINNII